MAGLVRMLLRLIAGLPRPVAQAAGSFIGRMSYLVDNRSAKVTRANLSLCFPGEDTETLVKRSLIETGRTMMETPAVWLGDLGRVDGWISEVRGEALLREAIAEDRGLLILLPHTGNWELFNVFYRRYGVMTALYHPPRQAFMKAVMAEVRARHGNTMVPTTRSGLKQLFRTLTSGGTVVVLPDQVPASGDYVPFFGVDALTDPLGVRLCEKTGARVLGMAILRNDNGQFTVHILAPDESLYAGGREGLVAINTMVETCARLSLPQYQWEYKRFRERPAGEQKIYRFGRAPARH